MVTESFCVDLPVDMFKMNFRYILESNNISYPQCDESEEYSQFRNHVLQTWEDNKSLIYRYLTKQLPKSYKRVDWSDDKAVTKAVAVMYIDYCYEHVDWCHICLETFWKELIIKSINSNLKKILNSWIV